MAEDNKVHAQVIKSTTIIGGSSVLNIIFKIIQSKAAALLLGPSGVGLMGVFNSVLGLAGMLAGMGLDTSGVRQIAEATSSDDQERIARTVTAFRWVAVFFGVIGAIVFFFLRDPITQLTFGSDRYQQYVGEMGFLALAVLAYVVSTAQSTLIRGMRRIGDLAKVSVLGIAIGTILGLPVLYFWRMQGIAWYLIFTALLTLLVSWWYARRIALPQIAMNPRQIWDDTKELVSMGFVFMISGLTTMLVTYLVKVLVLRRLGLDSAGLYEASGAISNVYVGFVLGAMGADYFPHLSSVVHDNAESTHLMNAQIEIGLLLAAPGILLVLALGPLVLQILYSAQFIPAFEILRWQSLGTFLRVISWPLAYLMLAKGEKVLFFWTELATNIFYLLALIVGLEYMGLPGIGVAFMFMYLFHAALTLLVARRLSKFEWSLNNLKKLGFIIPFVILAFFASYLPTLWAAIIGILLSVGVGIYSLRALYTLLGRETVLGYYQRIRARLGL